MFLGEYFEFIQKKTCSWVDDRHIKNCQKKGRMLVRCLIILSFTYVFGVKKRNHPKEIAQITTTYHPLSLLQLGLVLFFLVAMGIRKGEEIPSKTLATSNFLVKSPISIPSLVRLRCFFYLDICLRCLENVKNMSPTGGEKW